MNKHLHNNAISFIILLITTVACGKAPTLQDSTFATYLADFHTTYHLLLAQTQIEFVQTLPIPNALGQCEMGQDRVEIEESYWKTLTETSRKALVFHELGHCIFNRQHTIEKYEDNCSKSIMIAYLLDDACFIKHYDELIAELPNYTGEVK